MYHHAFTVFRLEHSIPQPELRHIALSVIIQPRAAALFIVAATRNDSVPVMRVIIDLNHLLDTSSNARYEEAMLSPTREYAIAVTTTVKELAKFLPISTLISPPATSYADNRFLSNRYLEWRRAIHLDMVTSFETIGIERYWKTSPTRPVIPSREAMYRTMNRLVAVPNRSPTFIARVGHWRYPPLIERQSLIMPPNIVRPDGISPESLSHRGEVIGEVRKYNDNVVRGVIDTRLIEGRHVLLVPKLAYPLQVDWAEVFGEKITALVSNEPVRFMEIMPEKSQRTSSRRP